MAVGDHDDPPADHQPLLLNRPQLHKHLCSTLMQPTAMPNREKPTKRVKYQQRNVNDSRSRTSRAIFDVNNGNESPVRSVGRLMSKSVQLLNTAVSDTGISSQKRQGGAAAVNKAETSGRSRPNQQMVKKKRPSTWSFTKIPTTDDGKKLDIPSVKNEVVQHTVLPDRTIFSQNVLNYGQVFKPVSHIQNAGTASLKLSLPTVQSRKHPDLNVITPTTVAQVIQGKFKNHLSQTFQLLDCRFPYEFQGGSLTGAKSLCDPKKMEMQLFSTATTIFDDSRRPVLIFFCEFSANRAPKMLRHVRNVDRSLHVDSYPELFYPELYLIEGGYKHCFETLRHEVCDPLALYVAMGDKRFTEMCRHEFAVWKRNWKLHQTFAKCVVKVKMSEKVSSCGSQARPTISGVRSLFQEL